MKQINLTIAEVETILSELNAARLALDRYTAHDIDCGVFGRRKVKICACGLDGVKGDLYRTEQALREKCPSRREPA